MTMQTYVKFEVLVIYILNKKQNKTVKATGISNQTHGIKKEKNNQAP